MTISKYKLIIFDWEGTLAYHSDTKEMLFPGVLSLLENLRTQGIDLAIATGKSQEGLNYSLEYFNIKQFFTVISSSSYFASKPEPDMLLHAIAVTNVSKSSALMVGDSLVDILAANAAGIDSCLINDSNQSLSTYQIEHISELEGL